MSKKPKLPTILTEERLKEITEDAVSHGYIALEHLPCIMAKEKGYAGILPKRWKKYQLGLRGPKEPEIKTERDRVGIWRDLFYRWAFGKVGGVRDGLKAISFLPAHSRNEVTGKLEEYDLESMDGVCYVKLNELGEYLIKNIRILLPPRLFPNHKDRIPLKEPPPEKIEPKEAIEYKDIMDKYKAKDFQLVNIIREELFKESTIDSYKAKMQPHSPASLQRIRVRDIQSQRNRPIFEEEKLDPNYSKEVGFVGDLLPRISECLCKQSEVEETLRKYDLYQEEKNLPKAKKLRPSQRHKIECRNVATKLWKKDPTITIRDMAYEDEINELFEGKTYADNTIRNWIKDICPNRSHGRRPKK